MTGQKRQLARDISRKLSTFSASELEAIRSQLRQFPTSVFSNRLKQFNDILVLLRSLSDSQLELIRRLANQFMLPHTYTIQSPGLINQTVLERVGDALLTHHTLSVEPFSKDKFEYALQNAFVAANIEARLAPKGNPGHDITIGGTRFSLKTQADANIKAHELHISKFMELGKGDWSNRLSDLKKLRNQFFSHMKSYDRILTLRNLRRPPLRWYYELVEIPKDLLLEARIGDLEMMTDSPQNPKPGYCRVRDRKGNLKYELYFDGGSERKLQIRHIDKKICIVHATWLLGSGDALF